MLLIQYKFFDRRTGFAGEKVSTDYRISTNDPSILGFAEKSKNLTSLRVEFLFFPTQFALRMHLCF